MDRHPGGPTTILAWAGKDASKFFNDIHKGVKTLGDEMHQNASNVMQSLGFWLGVSASSCVFPPRIDAYLRPEAFLGDLGVDENLMSDEFWHTLREACGSPIPLRFEAPACGFMGSCKCRLISMEAIHIYIYNLI